MDKIEKELRILLKRVNEEPEVITIENTLKAKQKLVSGLIEVVPYNEDTLIICNEEGKILNMLPNLLFDYDFIAGDCFFVGDDYKNGNFKSLTDEQIEKLKKVIKAKEFSYSSFEQNMNFGEKER